MLATLGSGGGRRVFLMLSLRQTPRICPLGLGCHKHSCSSFPSKPISASSLWLASGGTTFPVHLSAAQGFGAVLDGRRDRSSLGSSRLLLTGRKGQRGVGIDLPRATDDLIQAGAPWGGVGGSSKASALPPDSRRAEPARKRKLPRVPGLLLGRAWSLRIL